MGIQLLTEKSYVWILALIVLFVIAFFVIGLATSGADVARFVRSLLTLGAG